MQDDFDAIVDTAIKKAYITLDGLDDVAVAEIQECKNDIKSLFDTYTLRDTGTLIDSGTTTDTGDGIRIDYGVDYFKYVYHNSQITPSSAGTSSYWDLKALESTEFNRILDKAGQAIVDKMNRGE